MIGFWVKYFESGRAFVSRICRCNAIIALFKDMPVFLSQEGPALTVLVFATWALESEVVGERFTALHTELGKDTRPEALNETLQNRNQQGEIAAWLQACLMSMSIL